MPGHVKLTFTLDMPREVAERLTARTTRDGVNLEAVVVELLSAIGKRAADSPHPFYCVSTATLVALESLRPHP